MARWGADAVYEAAELFRKRCLVDGTSLLWPEHRSWSVETIDSLLQSLGDDPGEGTFFDKLRGQLANQPDDVLRVAADVLAFYFLFPSSNAVGSKRKRESIQTVVDWRPGASRSRRTSERCSRLRLRQGSGAPARTTSPADRRTSPSCSNSRVERSTAKPTRTTSIVVGVSSTH